MRSRSCRSLQGIAHEPESHFGYFYQGKALEAQEKRTEAKEAYRQAIERAKRFEPAYQALLKLYEFDADLQEAIQLYEQFVSSVRPRDETFRKDFVRFLVKLTRLRASPGYSGADDCG